MVPASCAETCCVQISDFVARGLFALGTLVCIELRYGRPLHRDFLIYAISILPDLR